MNSDEIIEQLKEFDFFEVYHKTSFICYRRKGNGVEKKVIVDVLDAGPKATRDLRYHVQATSEDGKLATGNDASSIDEALEIVHWDNLD